MQEHKTSSIEPRNLNPTFVIMAVAYLMFRCMWSCGHFSRLWKIAIDFHENALKYNKPILATEQDQRRQSSPPQFRVLCLAVKYYVIMHVRLCVYYIDSIEVYCMNPTINNVVFCGIDFI